MNEPQHQNAHNSLKTKRFKHSKHHTHIVRFVFVPVYAVARINDKWGAVDLHNNTLIEFVYEDAFDDKDNYVAVVQDGKMGCIGILDKAGVNILCKYDMMGHFNEKGYTAASQDGKWGVIDINDNVLAPFIYDRAYNPGYKNAVGLEHNGNCCIVEI